MWCLQRVADATLPHHHAMIQALSGLSSVRRLQQQQPMHSVMWWRCAPLPDPRVHARAHALQVSALVAFVHLCLQPSPRRFKAVRLLISLKQLEDE